jgi:regulatory protein
MRYEQALSKCMNLCSRREYCTFDIREKLYKWEMDDSWIEKIIHELISQKFLDDERYSRAFVNDKFRFNHWGKIKINHHLKHKQVNPDIIKNTLDNIDFDAYQLILKEEIQKKQKSVKAKNDFEKQGKIAQSIIAKGFEPGLVFEILKKES